MTAKKTTQKTAKPSAKKKVSKKAEPKELVTEFDWNFDEEPEIDNSSFRKMYWNLTVLYFKKWLNSFR